MNVIPNPYLNSSALLTAAAAAVSSAAKKDSRSTGVPIIKCVICEEVVNSGPSLNFPHQSGYQMLAVRPSIGSAGPFFPILECLTKTSAVQVPCCQTCSQSLLDQWNEYERKNISIPNRKYHLSRSKSLSLMNVESTAPSTCGTAVLVSSGQVQSEPLSLTINNGTMAIHKENTSAPAAASVSAPNSQYEVLDLSMSSNSGVNLSTKGSLSLAPSQTTNNTLNLSKSSTARPRANTASSNSSSDILPTPPILNSSMTNLIKVSSTPVSTLTLKSFDLAATSSPIPAKKALYSCALCEEVCPQLFSIFLKPMANSPFFPTLMPYVKAPMIDSNGKIGTCESCHRQLIQQYDGFQKSQKPISERQYTLVKPTKPSSVLLYGPNPSTTSTDMLHGSNSSILPGPVPTLNNRSMPVPSALSIVNPNKLYCVICHKDLLSSVISTDPLTQIAYSFLAESEPITGMPNKKLLVHVQTMQEVPLMQLITTPILQQQLLQTLQEMGKRLACRKCLEPILSISNPSLAIPSLNQSSSFLSLKTTPNGVASHAEQASGQAGDQVISDFMCFACSTNKAQVWVETKENASKKPFFPFLRDATEPNGRAKLCGACQLILETQWDAFEAAYIPYGQRQYRLNSNQNSLLLTRRPSNSSPAPVSICNSNTITSSIGSRVNGQPTPPPLKIQISSSSVVQPSTSQSCNSVPSDHLLLTTVNNTSGTINSLCTNILLPTCNSNQEDSIYKMIQDFLSNLGGPHPSLSGNCVVCGEFSLSGKTYQVYSNKREIILNRELGIYPYFPMLRSTVKKGVKNGGEIPHLVCLYCYHLLIAQWASFHHPSKSKVEPENRVYNTQDFVCYVCGVTTYRQQVSSIAVKEFPFLLQHKRPPGAISLFKGESVLTCANCAETLTHQWIENERMKVPLEMRKYNWMAVPPPPPPNSQISPSKNDNESKSVHSERNMIPNQTPLQINTNAHNGMAPVTAIVPKAIIINTSGDLVKAGAGNLNIVTPVVFNPTHTLAPLVAAAMAATPVTTRQEGGAELLTTPSNQPTGLFSSSGSTVGTISNTNSFADVLRHLARQSELCQTLPIKTEPSPFPTVVLNSINPNHQSSINLTTLASVAALAGNNRKQVNHQLPPSIFNHVASEHKSLPVETNLPRAIINSNSFAIHFNATNQTCKKENENDIHPSLDQPTAKKLQGSNVQQNRRMPHHPLFAQKPDDHQLSLDIYERNLSKVRLDEIRIWHSKVDRITRHYQKQMNGEEVEPEDFDEMEEDLLSSWDDDEEVESDSVVPLLESFIPVLPEEGEESPKVKFLSQFGMITQRRKRELELENYVRSKLNRRLSHVAFRIEEDEDEEFLDVDPRSRLQDVLPYFTPSGIKPDSEELNHDERKDDFLSGMGLKPTKNVEKLRTELGWLWMLKDRQQRLKSGVACGKLYNNLSDQVLNTWLPQLTRQGTSKEVVRLAAHLDRWLPLKPPEQEGMYFAEETLKPEEHSSPAKGQPVTHQPKTILITGTKRVESHDQHPSSSSIMDNQATGSARSSINPRLFAQEFHESVLLETQKQISKQQSVPCEPTLSNAIPVVNTLGSQHAQAPHAAIIYSDHLRPITSMMVSTEPHIERTNGIIAFAPNGTIKVQEKFVRDQIVKLQQRVSDISRETQLLIDKKNEIIGTIAKLDEEKTICQLELDRLTKCLEHPSESR